MTLGHSTLSNGSYGRVYVELPSRTGIALYALTAPFRALAPPPVTCTVAGVSRRAVTWTWDLDCSCKCQSLVLRITYRSLGIPSDVTLPPPCRSPPPPAPHAAVHPPRCRLPSPPAPPPLRGRYSAAIASTTRLPGLAWPSLPPPAAAAATGRPLPPLATVARPGRPLPPFPSSPSAVPAPFSLAQAPPPLAAAVRPSPRPAAGAPPSVIGAQLPRCYPAAPVAARPRWAVPRGALMAAFTPGCPLPSAAGTVAAATATAAAPLPPPAASATVGRCSPPLMPSLSRHDLGAAAPRRR